MAVSNDYLQYVLEQLSAVPRVTSRRLFGGIGLYCDGSFFGLIHDDTLFFKVDDSNRPDYTARNMAAFRPFADKPDLSMSYFEVPAEALEDRDELAAWARKAVAAAVASARARGPRSVRADVKAGRPSRPRAQGTAKTRTAVPAVRSAPKERRAVRLKLASSARPARRPK